MRMPDRWLIVQRTVEGREQRAFVGYIAETKPDGKGNLDVTANAPEALLADRRPAFVPPLIELATSPDAFNFWWPLLDYVFGLPDPRSFPPLPAGALGDEDRERVERYTEVAEALARSQTVNAADKGLFMRQRDATADAVIEGRFDEKDVQLGFAGLLRQCDSSDEPASFKRVCDRLWQAAGADDQAEVRQEQLKAWRKAIGRLHGRSLNQLMRDKLVKEEGAGVLDYDEPNSPQELLSAFAYGDLIHWGKSRSVVADWEQDEFLAAERRLAYFDAAVGLAHLYIGFGVLAQTALGQGGDSTS